MKITTNSLTLRRLTLNTIHTTIDYKLLQQLNRGYCKHQKTYLNMVLKIPTLCMLCTDKFIKISSIHKPGRIIYILYK